MSVFGKRPLVIAAMNAELPPFKNGEHNFESASILDLDITPLMIILYDVCTVMIMLSG